MNKFNKVITLIAVLFLVSCQSKLKLTDNGSDKGVWIGKVQMHDSANRKKIWGYVNWISESPKNRLRVDVQAVFGIPVATFILANGRADLWLHQEDKHIFSTDPKRLFAKLVRLPLDPQIFFALLSQQPRLPKSWSCNKKTRSIECKNMKDDVVLKLKNQSTNKRKIDIEKGSKSLQIALSRSKVQVPEKMFRPKKFPHYKQISL